MPSLPIYWNRCEGDIWGELYAVNLNHPHFDDLEGVYMIWLGGSKPAAICAGSGLIREKLAERRESPELQALREKSILVTWAKVDGIAAKGVERWLLENLRPKVPSPLPDSLPVEVNLPGRPGQAPPDAGDPPTQIQDLTAREEAPPATPPAAASFQSEFAELLKKAKPADEKLVQDALRGILKEAVKLGASEVHFDPLEGFLRVRFRVDGALEEALRIPSALNLRLVSHVRAACGLEAERGIGMSRPEEGRLSFARDGVEADLRLSTFPTTNGDKALLRLLPRDPKVRSIDELGLPAKAVDALRAAIARPRGMHVVTGPAGSGKSATLYALLRLADSPARSLMTLEESVDERIPGVSQGMVDPKAGFAEGLRALLRQEPDAVLVGELRDLETAALAASAAQAGRLILTTLHAGSALGAVARLLDMGLEPFLVASALSSVSAQRLARRVCAACARPCEATPEEAAELGHRVKAGGVEPPAGLLKGLKRGAGCGTCRQSGLAGRVALFEHVAITPALRALILKKAPLDELRAAAGKDGAAPLLSDGLRKAAEGLLPLSEVFRVVDSTDQT